MSDKLKSWLPAQLFLRSEPEKLDDLEAILQEPEPALGTVDPATACADSPGDSSSLSSGGTVAPAAQEQAEAQALPVSSGSQWPGAGRSDSPDKLAAHVPAGSVPPSTTADASRSSNNGWVDYLPRAPAWLQHASPASAAPQQGGQQDCGAQGADETQRGWQGYLPMRMPLLPSFGGSSSDNQPPAAPAREALPAAAAAATPDGSSSTDHDTGSGVASWATQAQHQLSSACQHTVEQLSTAGGTAVGVSVIGAAVGGIVAGPLGVAVGAKSATAMVAAGAMSGAALKYWKSSEPRPPEVEEQELQPCGLSKSSPPSQPAE